MYYKTYSPSRYYCYIKMYIYVYFGIFANVSFIASIIVYNNCYSYIYTYTLFRVRGRASFFYMYIN